MSTFFPIGQDSKGKLGRELVVNMVAPAQQRRSLKSRTFDKTRSDQKAILARVPKGTEELNSKAFQYGYEMMAEAMAARKK